MKKRSSKCSFTLWTICLCMCLPLTRVTAQQKNDYPQNRENINASEYMIPKRRGAEKFESNYGTEHLFFSAGVGVGYLMDVGSGHSAKGPKTFLYAGNWITPVIGIRGGIDYSMWKETKSTNLIGLSADYLVNVSAFAARYNPNRLFEVISIVGFNYQAAFIPDRKAIHSYGFHFGVQGKFNISPAFNLFIEPQIAIFPDRMDNRFSWRRYDLTTSLVAGITYKPSGFSESQLLQNGFASVAGGVGNTQGFLFNTEFALGKWFGKGLFNGVRVSVGSSTVFLETYDSKGENLRDPDFNVNLCVDYLCNFTRLFTGKEDHIFELSFVGGIGTYFPGAKSSAPVIINGRVGLQGQIRLTDNLGLWAEPRLNIFKDKSYRSDLQQPIRGNVGVMVGTSLKF